MVKKNLKNINVIKKSITKNSIDNSIISFYRSIYTELLDRATTLQIKINNEVINYKTKKEFLIFYDSSIILLLTYYIRIFYITLPAEFNLSELNDIDFTFDTDALTPKKFLLFNSSNYWSLQWKCRNYPLADSKLQDLINQLYYFTLKRINEACIRLDSIQELQIDLNEPYLLAQFNICYSYTELFEGLQPSFHFLDTFITPNSSGSQNAYINAVQDIKQVLVGSQDVLAAISQFSLVLNNQEDNSMKYMFLAEQNNDKWGIDIGYVQTMSEPEWFLEYCCFHLFAEGVLIKEHSNKKTDNKNHNALWTCSYFSQNCHYCGAADHNLFSHWKQSESMPGARSPVIGSILLTHECKCCLIPTFESSNIKSRHRIHHGKYSIQDQNYNTSGHDDCKKWNWFGSNFIAWKLPRIYEFCSLPIQNELNQEFHYSFHDASSFYRWCWKRSEGMLNTIRVFNYFMSKANERVLLEKSWSRKRKVSNASTLCDPGL